MRKITLDSLKPARIDRSMHSVWAAKNATVMLVDSQPIFLDILSACFSQRGFNEVLTASSWDDAVELMSSRKPELIVVGFDGDETDTARVIELIKQDSAYQSIPLLVIASSEFKSQAKARFHLSEENFFCKPVDTGRLVNVAIDRIEEQGLRKTISATARRSRAVPASDKYRRLRKIVGRS